VTVSDVESHVEAEGLTLLKADNKTGYFGVYHHPGKPKPYEARMRPSSRRRSARVAGPSGNAGSDHLLCLSFVSERFSFCLSR
jgi:hypothetical protein